MAHYNYVVKHWQDRALKAEERVKQLEAEIAELSQELQRRHQEENREVG